MKYTITSLQPRAPKRLDIKEGRTKDACISMGKENRRDIVGKLRAWMEKWKDGNLREWVEQAECRRQVGRQKVGE